MFCDTVSKVISTIQISCCNCYWKLVLSSCLRNKTYDENKKGVFAFLQITVLNQQNYICHTGTEVCLGATPVEQSVKYVDAYSFRHSLVSFRHTKQNCTLHRGHLMFFTLSSVMLHQETTGGTLAAEPVSPFFVSCACFAFNTQITEISSHHTRLAARTLLGEVTQWDDFKLTFVSTCTTFFQRTVCQWCNWDTYCFDSQVLPGTVTEHFLFKARPFFAGQKSHFTNLLEGPLNITKFLI